MHRLMRQKATYSYDLMSTHRRRTDFQLGKLLQYHIRDDEGEDGVSEVFEPIVTFVNSAMSRYDKQPWAGYLTSRYLC